MPCFCAKIDDINCVICSDSKVISLHEDARITDILKALIGEAKFKADVIWT